MIDHTAIWAEIRQRNALRRSAMLPLLDEQAEFAQACRLAKSVQWSNFRASKRAEHDRIRDELTAERGWPTSYMSAWSRGIEVEKRFKAFLNANYPDEMARLRWIGPDYLAITKDVIEEI